MKALSIIKTEHRSLGAILFTLRQIVGKLGENDHANAPFNALHGIVYYLDNFLDRYHHPKESRYLFPALIERYPESMEIVKALGKEHAEGERLLIDLLKALSAYEFVGAPRLAALKDATERYVSFEMKHAKTEESELFPLAREHLTDDDWEKIDQVFADHSDPLFGDEPSSEFRNLFREIGNQVPAPYGFGSA